MTLGSKDPRDKRHSGEPSGTRWRLAGPLASSALSMAPRGSLKPDFPGALREGGEHGDKTEDDYDFIWGAKYVHKNSQNHVHQHIGNYLWIIHGLSV